VNDYITLLTNCKLDLFSDNPRERQKQMALEVTSAFYGIETAKLAQKNAEEIVLNLQSDNSSAEIPEISIASIEFPIPLANLLKNLNLVSGTSDAKRRIKSGAIKLAGTKVEDDSIIIECSDDVTNQIIQLSKRELYRFKQ
jgi:tyrosyl-tRNA synthetase